MRRKSVKKQPSLETALYRAVRRKLRDSAATRILKSTGKAGHSIRRRAAGPGSHVKNLERSLSQVVRDFERDKEILVLQHKQRVEEQKARLDNVRRMHDELKSRLGNVRRMVTILLGQRTGVEHFFLRAFAQLRAESAQNAVRGNGGHLDVGVATAHMPPVLDRRQGDNQATSEQMLMSVIRDRSTILRATQPDMSPPEDALCRLRDVFCPRKLGDEIAPAMGKVVDRTGSAPIRPHTQHNAKSTDKQDAQTAVAVGRLQQACADWSRRAAEWQRRFLREQDRTSDARKCAEALQQQLEDKTAALLASIREVKKLRQLMRHMRAFAVACKRARINARRILADQRYLFGAFHLPFKGTAHGAPAQANAAPVDDGLQTCENPLKQRSRGDVPPSVAIHLPTMDHSQQVASVAHVAVPGRTSAPLQPHSSVRECGTREHVGSGASLLAGGDAPAVLLLAGGDAPPALRSRRDDAVKDTPRSFDRRLSSSRQLIDPLTATTDIGTTITAQQNLIHTVETGDGDASIPEIEYIASSGATEPLCPVGAEKGLFKSPIAGATKPDSDYAETRYMGDASANVNARGGVIQGKRVGKGTGMGVQVLSGGEGSSSRRRRQQTEDRHDGSSNGAAVMTSATVGATKVPDVHRPKGVEICEGGDQPSKMKSASGDIGSDGTPSEASESELIVPLPGVGADEEVSSSDVVTASDVVIQQYRERAKNRAQARQIELRNHGTATNHGSEADASDRWADDSSLAFSDDVSLPPDGDMSIEVSSGSDDDGNAGWL